MNTPDSQHPMGEQLRQVKPKADSTFLLTLATQIETALEAKEKNMQATMPIQTQRHLPKRLLRSLVAGLVVVLFAGAMLALSLSRPDRTISTVLITPTVSPAPPTCTVEPQTGWLVHQVETDETLKDIAEIYRGNAETLAGANCLDNEATLPSFVYVPLHSQQVLMTNQQVDAGTTIDPAMLKSIWVASAEELPFTMLERIDFAGYMAVMPLSPYSILNAQNLIAMNLPSAGDTVKLDIPIDFDPKLENLEIGDRFAIAVYFEMCRKAENQALVIPGVVDCQKEIAFTFTPKLLAVIDPTTITVEVGITESPILEGVIKLDQEVMMVVGDTSSQEDWVTVDLPLSESFDYRKFVSGDPILVVMDVSFCHQTDDADGCIDDPSSNADVKNIFLGKLESLVLSIDDPNAPSFVRVKVTPRDAMLLTWAIEKDVPFIFMPLSTAK